MKIISALLVLAIFLFPQLSFACACGCGIFDVGTSSMFSSSAGTMAYLEYDFMDQNQNRFGNGTAPAANNDDLQIKTHFVTAGVQQMFSKSWGAQIDVPMVVRYYQGLDDNGNAFSVNHISLGDIRLKGIYTGFSDNMNTGLIFGVKIPTGSWQTPFPDRDTQIGTGSTDLLLGIYHMDYIASLYAWSWFVRLNLDQPVLDQDDYLPGTEIDGGIGVIYNKFTFGDNYKIAPMAQLLTSLRGADTGSNADTLDSGYQRLFLSPGLEFGVGSFRIYGDIAFPFYQNFNGNQLAANELYKLVMSYSF